MSSTSAAILSDLATTLRSTGTFALVTLGASPTSSVVPRAAVTYEGQDEFRPDDTASARWMRLRSLVTIHSRSDNPATADRVVDLAESASEAILADPYRNQLCQDLPTGRATEIGSIELAKGIRRPEVELSFNVWCHFEQQEGT